MSDRSTARHFCTQHFHAKSKIRGPPQDGMKWHSVESERVRIWKEYVAEYYTVLHCCDAIGNQRFRVSWWLHLQGETHISTQCHNPEDRELNLHRRKNLKSCIVTLSFAWTYWRKPRRTSVKIVDSHTDVRTRNRSIAEQDKICIGLHRDKKTLMDENIYRYIHGVAQSV